MDTTNERQAGKPRTNVVLRPLDPPMLVVIDLAALYGKQPHFRRPNVVVLPMLHVDVIGYLDAWVVTETGWFGVCRYRVKLAHGQFMEQSHLVPGWMLRRATRWEAEQGQMRGELWKQ